MNSYRNVDNQHRRYQAYVSTLGTTQLHPRNPYVIAWWSATFPGFGHFLLGKYLRGFALFLWEIVVNVNSQINLGMVDAFCGHIEAAKHDLHPRWLIMYFPVFFFAIWDSYRTTVDLNNVALLAQRENAPFNTFAIGSAEINYLDKRNPVMSVLWSLMMPGLGQLHIHRVVMAFFLLIWTIVFFYESHVLQADQWLVLGQISRATQVLNKEWLLFIPSILGFAIYDAYANTVENNKLYDSEQANYLRKHYQQLRFTLIKGERSEP
ncbi:MAG: hypothetical protein OWT28_05130 [Firmicutes bacterium]|nr:hypothetical protein [Bacillota bacterium]